MKTKLKNLVITKVALVDEGSCSAADIQLYKRKSEGGNKMTFDEVIKSLPEDQQKIVTAEFAKAKEMLPEGAMSAEEAAKMKAQHEAEMKKSKEGTQENPEDILKNANLDPAVRDLVEKSLARSKAAEIAVIKMQEEKRDAELVAKSSSLSKIPEADTKVLNFLKSISGVAGAVDTAMDIFGTVNTLIEKGAAFQEMGSNGNAGSANTAGSDAAWAAIEKAANDLVAKGQVSKQKAITMVMEQQPELYAAYTEALRAE